MKNTFAIFAVFVLLIAATASASGKIINVEVGKGYGCNLIPIFEGRETSYSISGSAESARKIVFQTDEEITRVEVSSTPLDISISQSPHQVTINLLRGTDKYKIRIYFVPARAGLMSIHLTNPLGNSTIQGTVWLKVIPVDAPLPFDVNWDGKIDEDDVRAVLEAVQTQRHNVPFCRCDINGDQEVNKGDLIIVRKKAGLNPYDFNNDGKVNINDFAVLFKKDKATALAPAKARPPFVCTTYGGKFKGGNRGK